MVVYRMTRRPFLLLGVLCLAVTLRVAQGGIEPEGPSESECRPYIEKALRELETPAGDESEEAYADLPLSHEPEGEIPTGNEETEETVTEGDDNSDEVDNEDLLSTQEDDEVAASAESGEDVEEKQEEHSVEKERDDESDEIVNNEADPVEAQPLQQEEIEENQEVETVEIVDVDSKEQEISEEDTKENETESVEENSEENENETETETHEESSENDASEEDKEKERIEVRDEEESVEEKESVEEGDPDDGSDEGKVEETEGKSAENVKEDDENESVEGQEDDKESEEDNKENGVSEEVQEKDEESKEVQDKNEIIEEIQDNVKNSEESEKEAEEEQGTEEQSDNSAPEEELVDENDVPVESRPTDHIKQLLHLDDENSQNEKIIDGIAEITLRDLKRLYDNAIKPLETLYKYRDLSNRHFGDAEIFSKPLVLFMGPWSGGKSSIINYLLENEYGETSLRTGAEPSPAYFNILMYGDEPEVLDGTQLAADFTFSGLQKFGQGLEERLRGSKLPLNLLKKINIVEIPGILEVRKQISRVFPFNDACQWFIDRADIIYLIYDPSKLDVGPETEAILDQLKGREHQTRIILNKADRVKPEELMRVQGALIWNISPLMSSAQPPVMYTTSLWSRPYETWAPVRLLQAQERAFLRDLRSAVDKRVENKIASARRFAVRVRNHAKMVDCYLTTYYNHKSVFGNRKQVSDAIIEHPQDYHIYEGLSTLTNISRYDLPDPDVYRDFFRLNPLYDFQKLSSTCTYFRGCPINRLDVAIAYDLPELVGKHKRMLEAALNEAASTSRTTGS